MSGLNFSAVKLLVHAIAKCTIKAIQIVPDADVSRHKTIPSGIAPMVSSKPFGICVAEYNATLMAIAGHIPNGSNNGTYKTPLNRNSYPNK